MSDDRNFRYFYYEKVGFRGVEEKKSLDILLAEKPNDLLSKLSSFTHRFQMPGMYRKVIWKLLLDVTDPHSHCDDLIPIEQNLLCDDMIRGLQIMLCIDDNCNNSKLLVLMFLLEFSEIDLNKERQFQRAEIKDLMAISDVFVKEFIVEKNSESLKETYWLFRNLISSVRANLATLLDTYDRFIYGLSQDDPTLHCHLIKLGVIRSQTTTAINSGVSQDHTRDYGLISHRPLITWIYDRIVGALIHGNRPFAVLSSVGRAVLLLLRTELLESNTYEEITKRLLSPLTVEQSEEVIIKAVSP